MLLASDGTPFTRDVIDRVVEIAGPERATITVVVVARVYGTSLGLPHPGLQPMPHELAQARALADGAAEDLRAHGFDVRVAMSKSRNANKMIARWAQARNFHAVVVPERAKPAWRKLLEGEATREIGRRCDAPVYSVPVPYQGARGRRSSGGAAPALPS